MGLLQNIEEKDYKNQQNYHKVKCHYKTLLPILFKRTHIKCYRGLNLCSILLSGHQNYVKKEEKMDKNLIKSLDSGQELVHQYHQNHQ